MAVLQRGSSPEALPRLSRRMIWCFCRLSVDQAGLPGSDQFCSSSSHPIHYNNSRRNGSMRWTPGGDSQDIEDRRDESGDGGSGFGLPFGGMHIGLGGVVILLILSLLFKRNFFAALGGGAPVGPRTSVTRPDTARDQREQPLKQFVSFVLDDTQKTWEQILPEQGVKYRHAKLVLFRNSTYSGCGSARAATGPFYCPADEKVYIDLDFYDEL